MHSPTVDHLLVILWTNIRFRWVSCNFYVLFCIFFSYSFHLKSELLFLKLEFKGWISIFLAKPVIIVIRCMVEKKMVKFGTRKFITITNDKTNHELPNWYLDSFFLLSMMYMKKIQCLILAMIDILKFEFCCTHGSCMFDYYWLPLSKSQSSYNTQSLIDWFDVSIFFPI